MSSDTILIFMALFIATLLGLWTFQDFIPTTETSGLQGLLSLIGFDSGLLDDEFIREIRNVDLDGAFADPLSMNK